VLCLFSSSIRFACHPNKVEDAPPYLHVLAMPDALDKLGRRRRWFYAKLAEQGRGAHLILTDGEVILALAAVAAHQPAMGILAAVVLGQNKLA
jgi:hypothetical protein